MSERSVSSTSRTRVFRSTFPRRTFSSSGMSSSISMTRFRIGPVRVVSRYSGAPPRPPAAPPRYHRFDRPPLELERGPLPPELLDGGDNLVSKESIALLESGEEDVHGPLSRDASESRGDGAPDPEVFLRGAQEGRRGS